MPFVIAPDGVRLKYELEGQGPPLLLHLGSGCDSELWRAAGYVPALSESYQCILFDHRGHGESDHPRGAEANHIDRYVADLLALLDHLAVERTAFWGYSAGIDAGLKLADEHPGRVWALIGSGGLGHQSPEENAEYVARRVPEYREHGWEKLLERFDDQEPDPVPEWMKRSIRATDLEPVIDYLQAYPLGSAAGDWDYWEALTRITAPALFLTGELEDPEDGTAEAVARMPNATRIRLYGQGHINAFLRSDLVLPRVEGFLARYAP
jgi:pimeloyl-ACP methyl ester carboxylesterase